MALTSLGHGYVYFLGKATAEYCLCYFSQQYLGAFSKSELVNPNSQFSIRTLCTVYKSITLLLRNWPVLSQCTSTRPS